MKSLFSCFPRKIKKSKSNTNNSKSEPITEYKDTKVETATVNVNGNTIHENNANGNNIKGINEEISEIFQYLDDQGNDEIIKINKLKEDETKKRNDELIKRLEECYNRINNVFSVLNGKRKMHDLFAVIESLKEICFLCDKETNTCFDHELNVLKNMILLQINLLECINKRKYDKLNLLFNNWKLLVQDINSKCYPDNNLFEIYRILSDSILIFGWVNCSESPKEFVTSTADGCIVCVNNYISKHECEKYIPFLRLWTQIIKTFAGVISKNFQIALIWGINGSRPINIIQTIMELNYANFKPQKIVGKQKVLQTKRPEEVTYDEMNSLMDDLREGKQIKKLRKTNIRSQDLDKSNNIYELLNHHNKNDLEIKASVPSEAIVIVKKCENCSIHVSTVVKSILLDSCSSVHVLLDDVLDKIELIQNNNLEIQVIGEKINKTEISNCKDVKLFLPRSSHQTFLLNKNSSNENIQFFVTKNDEGGFELEDFVPCLVNNEGKMDI